MRQPPLSSGDQGRALDPVAEPGPVARLPYGVRAGEAGGGGVLDVLRRLVLGERVVGGADLDDEGVDVVRADAGELGGRGPRGQRGVGRRDLVGGEVGGGARRRQGHDDVDAAVGVDEPLGSPGAGQPADRDRVVVQERPVHPVGAAGETDRVPGPVGGVREVVEAVRVLEDAGVTDEARGRGVRRALPQGEPGRVRRVVDVHVRLAAVGERGHGVPRRLSRRRVGGSGRAGEGGGEPQEGGHRGEEGEDRPEGSVQRSSHFCVNCPEAWECCFVRYVVHRAELRSEDRREVCARQWIAQGFLRRVIPLGGPCGVGVPLRAPWWTTPRGCLPSRNAPGHTVFPGHAPGGQQETRRSRSARWRSWLRGQRPVRPSKSETQQGGNMRNMFRGAAAFLTSVAAMVALSGSAEAKRPTPGTAARTARSASTARASNHATTRTRPTCTTATRPTT